jgi:hypothetical protein
VEDIATESSIICVTESHLDTNIIDNDILIDGFSDKILRKDRNCFGGYNRLTLDPMGKCSNAFFSETINMIKTKLYMNVH